MIKGILLFIALAAIAIIVVIIAGLSPDELKIIAQKGYLPRAVAWACLLLGVYGLARRRFSPFLMMLFYAAAFFFTYIGQFILEGMY